MRRLYYILCILFTTLSSCQFKLTPDVEKPSEPLLAIERYDRLEYRYLTTGDFSALQSMNTEYPIETRTLIEDVIKVGDATAPDINTRFLKFYQDTTLQSLIAAVEAEYANIDDLNRQLNSAFKIENLITKYFCAKGLCADIGLGPKYSCREWHNWDFIG